MTVRGTAHLKVLAALIAIAAASALGTSSLPAAADSATTAFSIPISHVALNPKIDGTLDDPAWKNAAHVQLDWDFQFRRAATERTDAYIMADKQYLYVAFVAQQSEAVTANLHTNDVGVGSDDVVRVYLFPGGDHGFEYMFASTPIGTHNEFSSENDLYAPHWTSVGKRTATGYVVTEQIPLNVMRGDGRATWLVQFERVVHVTNQDYEWAHDPGQNGVDSTKYIGQLTGMTVAQTSTRIKPRFGVYTLGQLGVPSTGGDTSHMGADIALPITDTSSFFSTIHPDYSNVDVDQQTISPTAFTRTFQEVRPFFTQGINFYNNFNCNDCYDVPFLYTPNIPTPRDGFAAEGVQGLAQFAAYDALGSAGRDDDAQSIIWQTPDKDLDVDALHFSTFEPGIIDNTQIFQATYGNRHNESAYITDGWDSGTFVTDPSEGQYREFGLNLFTSKSGFFPAYHEIGSQYAPIDGLQQDNDLYGPTLYTFKEFDGAPTSYIQSVNIGEDYERFHNTQGVEDLADAFTNITVKTKTQYALTASTGYQYIMLSNNYGSMIDQNGVSLTYGGNSSTPTSVTYNIGRFGPGYLRSTTRLTTLRLGPRGTVTFEGDNTNDWTDAQFGGAKNVQWLERASFAYQLGSGSSLAIGVRKIIGTTPLLEPPAQFTDATNLSLAYYKRVGSDELYVVYGDPNQLTTYHAFIVKFVHYFGADKGV